MQALRYDAYGATPALVEVPDPECPDDGVVIEVRATGVCRSTGTPGRGTIRCHCRRCRATSSPGWSSRSAAG